MTLRILHTESSWGWGGQELRILTESQALVERGHQVCIAAPEDTPILHRAAQMGLEGVALPIRKKRLSGYMAMRRLLKARRFDIVNTHSSTDSWLAALAAMGSSRPPALVRTRHVSTDVHAGLTNRWLFGQAVHRVVTTGEVVRLALIERLRLDPAHVVSVPTGVSSHTYRPGNGADKQWVRNQLQVPSGTTVVGTVATLRLLKGVNHLFEAIRQVELAPVHLVVIGDGPQMASLQALRVELGLEARVSMVGEQSNVDAWLRGLDLFAFPSLAEGVPQALTQAMLTGLPCVTTNIGGIPELAIHLQTAWVCPPRDASALARGIEVLFADPPLRESLGRNARKHCIETRSIETMADAMEKVFHEAHERRR